MTLHSTSIVAVNIFGMGLERHILGLPSLPAAVLPLLAAHNIRRLGALAELDRFELSAIIYTDEDTAGKIVMEARTLKGCYGLPKPCFDRDAIMIRKAITAGMAPDDIGRVLHKTLEHIYMLAQEWPEHVFTERPFYHLPPRLTLPLTKRERRREKGMKPRKPHIRVTDDAVRTAHAECNGKGVAIAAKLNISQPTVTFRCKKLNLPLLGHKHGQRRPRATPGR